MAGGTGPASSAVGEISALPSRVHLAHKGKVLVPGCADAGHEAALLAELGFSAVALDFSSCAIQEARGFHGPDRSSCVMAPGPICLMRLRSALAGLTKEALDGGVEPHLFSVPSIQVAQGLPRHDPKDCSSQAAGCSACCSAQSREGARPLAVTRRSCLPMAPGWFRLRHLGGRPRGSVAQRVEGVLGSLAKTRVGCRDPD